MIELFKELNGYKNLRDDHAHKMSKTPFGSLYSMFKDGVLSLQYARKPFGAIRNILTTYSNQHDSFVIGGKRIQLRVEDMSVVFGLNVSGELQKIGDDKSELAEKYWKGLRVVSNQELTTAIRSVVNGKEKEDVEDFCKMVKLLMISTIFQCGNGSGVNLQTIALVDDFDKIQDIGWAQLFYNELITQIRKWNPKKPFSITNCAVLLLYFILEHTNILEGKKKVKDIYPRVAKWSFSKLKEELKKKKIKFSDFTNLANIEVKQTLVFTTAELKLFGKESSEQIKDDTQVVEQKCASTMNEFEDLMEKILTEKNELIQRVSELQKTENLSKARIDLLEESDRMAHQKIKDLESNLQMANNHLEMLKAENAKLLTDLQNSRDENTYLISKTLLCEELELQIEVLEQENISLKDQNMESEESKVNSTIRKIKDKTRKRKEDSAFVYQPIKKSRKEAASSSTADIVEVDATGNELLFVSPAPPMVSKKLPDVTRSAYYKYLTSEQKKTIRTFFKNNTESSIAWENKDKNFVILGLDLKKIMFDEFISERIIDWFAFHLQRSALNSSSSDQYKAEIFPAGLCVCFTENNQQLAGKQSYLKREIDDKIIELNFKDTEALIFPMIHRKSNQDKTGIHWTLLVCDTTDWSWSHYDSSTRKARGMVDTRRDATKLQKRVNSALCKHENLSIEEKKRLEAKLEIVTCPNQGETVNCGLYVCMFMESLFVKKSQPTSISNEEGAKLVEQLKWSIPIKILEWSIPIKILEDNNLSC